MARKNRGNPEQTAVDGNGGDPTIFDGEFYTPYVTAVLQFCIAHPGTVLLGLAAAGFGLAWWLKSRSDDATQPETEGFTYRQGFTYMMGVPEPVVAGMRFTTYAIVSTLLAVLILAGALYFDIPYVDIIPVVLLASVFAIGRRGREILTNRAFFIDQMFTIANTRLRYRASADQVKDQYIQATEWDPVTNFIPKSVTIMYPASAPVSKEEFRNEFETHFTEQAVEGCLWDFTWETTNNRVLVTAQPPIPTKAYLPFPTTADFPWNELPLGVTIGGEPVTWDVLTAPHAAVTGKSGSGKSNVQRNMLLHCLSSPEWSVALLDPKIVELAMYEDADAVYSYATSEEEMHDLLIDIVEQMGARYALMRQHRVANYRLLPDGTRPKALLVMVDETTTLMTGSGGKESKVFADRNKESIGRIAREGRAAGVHMVVAMQRPDAAVLGGATRETIEFRVAMGRMSATASQMILDDARATMTPSRPGRGIVLKNDKFIPMQGFLFEEKFIAPTMELINAMYRGEMTPQEVRELMYPNDDAPGGVDAERSPGVQGWESEQVPGWRGNVRSVWVRVKAASESYAEKARATEDAED